MTSTSSVRQFDHHAAIQSRPEHRYRRAGSAGSHQCRRPPFCRTDLPNPPIYSKINPADAPILTLALTSDTLPLSKVEDLADTTLAQKISQLTGVGLVSISGGQKPAVRIQANPTALASYGLSLEDLRTALDCSQRGPGQGRCSMGRTSPITIGANDQLLSSERLSKCHHRLSQWRPCAADRRCHCHRRRGKCLASRVDEPASRPSS